MSVSLLRRDSPRPTKRTSKQQGAAVSLEPPVLTNHRRANMKGAMAVIAASVLAGVLWFNSYNNRVPVVVAAADLEQGSVIQPEDLKIVDIAGADDINSARSPKELTGKVVNSPVKAGDVVSSSNVGAAVAIAEGESVVGVVLGPGQYPTQQLRPGDVVDVFASGDEGSSLRVAESVVIFDVSPPDDIGSNKDYLVALVLNQEQAAAVTGAADQTNGVRIALRGSGTR